MAQALTEKYRPETFDDVIGHDSVVAALQHALKNGTNRAFLFTGPSGVGKTTLARICATEVGCLPQDRMDIDGATYTGIDDMRMAASRLLYRPLGDGAVKACIIDEVHAVSKNAIQSLLAILEKPPDWVYWFLCTTEPMRILTTIRTRCLSCDLKPVLRRDLIALLAFIAKKEKLCDGPQGPDLIALCAEEANGSPRQAIANLALCAVARSLEEAEELLRSAQGAPEAFELAKALAYGAGWSDIQVLLDRLRKAEVNPEGVRHVVRDYMTKVILGAKKEESAGRGLEILSAFSQPCHPSDGISPIVLACGKATLS